MRTESRELLAVGIFGSKSRRFGSNIGDRIEMLLRRGRTFSPRASATGVAAGTLVLGGLMFATSLAPRWIAFAQEPARLTFDVASVKPNYSGRLGSDGFQIAHGALTVRNVSLKMLIEAAYAIQGVRISGGPAWLNSDRYDVDARGTVTADKQQVWFMLRSLLADRFKLGLRTELRQLPIYSLEVGKSGPKLHRREYADCESASTSAASSGRVLLLLPCGEVGKLLGPEGAILWARRIPASGIAGALSDLVDRPVVDSTGLAGAFDVELKWTPEGYKPFAGEGEVRRPADSTEPGPSIFVAVQEQLGLKLQSSKGPVKVMVIDHAEKPDGN